MRPLSHFVVPVIPAMIRAGMYAALRLALRDTQARPIGRTVALFFLVCIAALTALAHAADDRDFRSGVVRIESTSVEGKVRKGAGFVVSIEDGVAFIMTAAHVVAGDKTPQIELFSHPLQIEASVIRQDLQFDIALLIVRGSDKLFEVCKRFRWVWGGSLRPDSRSRPSDSRPGCRGL